MKELFEAMGWENIVSKNRYMTSYVKEDKRLNYYYTTGMITIQGTDGSFQKFPDTFTEGELEKILNKLNT